MEPQYSVLLFSKYSQNCNKLFSIMTNSGVNFSPLQSLCIDNENIRKRILDNKQFNITVVPSILSVFSNGNVETYEGVNAFNWVQSIIAKFTPPPPQLPPQPTQPPQQLPPPVHLPPPPPRRIPRRVVEQEEEDYEVDVNKMRTRSSGNDPKGLGEDPEDDLPVLSQKEISALQRSIEDRGDTPKSSRSGETKVKIRPKMEPRDEPVRRGVSPLSQIPFSEDSEDEEPIDIDRDDDRHKTIRKPPRIRHDEGNYEEDDTLFNDEIVEHRKEPKNTVKQKAQKSTKELNNIKSKADALALDREMSEKEINKPVTRSDSEFRRP